MSIGELPWEANWIVCGGIIEDVEHGMPPGYPEHASRLAESLDQREEWRAWWRKSGQPRVGIFVVFPDADSRVKRVQIRAVKNMVRVVVQSQELEQGSSGEAGHVRAKADFEAALAAIRVRFKLDPPPAWPFVAGS